MTTMSVMHGSLGGASVAGQAAQQQQLHREGHPHLPLSSSLFLSPSSFSTIDRNVDVKFDFHAGALSVDATGSCAVLAGRKGLHVIDLDVPYAPAATFHHQTKWDVTVVKCNPHVAFKSFVASTSNHNTLIWNITTSAKGSGGGYQPQPLVATLRGHTRPVSDVSWSPSEPTLLATCSADAKTHLWDTRAPQRPIQTLHAFTTGAVQVQWHSVDATTLATAHEGEVRIWDTRASDKTPAVLITAHMQKIYGIDWHPKRMDELLTCSEDKTVKFWNVTQPRVCLGTLVTAATVGCARYTPFGDGVVTSSNHRQDTALRLWSLSYSQGSEGIGASVSGDSTGNSSIIAAPVRAFTGHADVVKSFEWRERGSANGTPQYQLVSWSKNQELRMWRIDHEHMEACGAGASAQVSRLEAATAADDANETDGAASHSIRGTLEQYTALARLREDLAMSKYDVSALKSDLARSVVPASAVPLASAEYSLLPLGDDFRRHDGDGREDPEVVVVSLTFDDDDDLGKASSDAHASDDDTDDEDDAQPHSTTRESLTAATTTATTTVQDEQPSRTAVLPCPRIFSGCFSGPNLLVVFDSRGVLGLTRLSHVGAASPPMTAMVPGKSNNQLPSAGSNLKKMPRTYEQLLELRDPRGGKKKHKKHQHQNPLMTRMHAGGASGAGSAGGGITSFHNAGAMEIGMEWPGAPVDFFDANRYRAEDTGDHRLYGHRGGGGSFFNAGLEATGGGEGGAGAGGAAGEGEFAVHGGSEYFKMYFSNSEFHLPINNPDHRTSMPPHATASSSSSAIQGLSLSPPRAAAAAAALRGGRGMGLSMGLGMGMGMDMGMNMGMGPSRSSLLDIRAVDQPPSSLASELTQSVTVLDLSQLCGVSSVLTYATQLRPATRRPVRQQQGDNEQQDLRATTETSPLDAGTKDLYQWMLHATTSSRRVSGLCKRRTAARQSIGSPVATMYTSQQQPQHQHPLSRILEALLVDGGGVGLTSQAATYGKEQQQQQPSTVSDVCARNAQIASLAGRTDLHQVWALLELSTASVLQLPHQQQQQQQQQQAHQQPPNPLAAFGSFGVSSSSSVGVNGGGDTLATAHPWRAHPFGQGLVKKMLAMYETAGDLPTLASIVCALRPAQPQHEDDEEERQQQQQQQQQQQLLLQQQQRHAQLAASVTGSAASGSTTTAPSFTPVAKVTTSPFSRSRTSFNSLSQLLSGPSDESNPVPPMRRSARRSSSHNEVPKLSAQVAESPTIAAYKASAKDWPMAGRGTSTGTGTGGGGGTGQQQLSPALGPASAAMSRWKGLDLDKRENSVKTWSAGSSALRADASPRPLTQDTFNSPHASSSAAGLLAMPQRRRRGSSIMDSDDETSLAGRIVLQVEKHHSRTHTHSHSHSHSDTSALSTHPDDEQRYDAYKEAYADLLYRYGALNQRSDVLKTLTSATDACGGGGTSCSTEEEENDNDDDRELDHDGLVFGVLCRSCQNVTSGMYCSACRDFAVKCSICMLAVRGQSMYCLTCGHGGHAHHLREWFAEEDACPTGCGCWCKQATALAMNATGQHAADHKAVIDAAAVAERLHARSYSF